MRALAIIGFVLTLVGCAGWIQGKIGDKEINIQGKMGCEGIGCGVINPINRVPDSSGADNASHAE